MIDAAGTPERSSGRPAWPAAAAGWYWSDWKGTSRPAFAIDDVVNNDLLVSASFAGAFAAWAEVTALLGSGPIRHSPLITYPVNAGPIRGRLPGAAGKHRPAG